MAIHSSILSWRIPWTEKAGRLQSVGSQRVRHDWATNTHILFLQKKKKKKKVIGILIGIALNQSILLGSDILILNLLTMSMIHVSTILWLIILSAMSYHLFTSLLPLQLTPKYFFFMLLSAELFHNFPFKLFIVMYRSTTDFFVCWLCPLLICWNLLSLTVIISVCFVLQNL